VTVHKEKKYSRNLVGSYGILWESRARLDLLYQVY